MSLANPFFFVGVARIRTIIGIHQVVPFGPHHLVVFCPCFRLASEHGRHCRCILIGKDCTQILAFMSLSFGHVCASRPPHIRPRPRRLECPSRVMLSCSLTAMPSSLQTSATCLVLSMSA